MHKLIRIIAVFSFALLLLSCRWGTDKKVKQEEPESPVIQSLKDASIPCFKCHPYEKFSIDESGKFSHKKHGGFGLHCNQCHIIKPHTESTVKAEFCNNCHKLTTFTYTASGMPAKFTHQNHAKRTGCDECHPKIFKTKKGGTKITMDLMYKGESCGTCHNGKKAFASTACNKCHPKTSFPAVIAFTAKGMKATFTHQNHSKRLGCNECHPRLFKMKKGSTNITMDLMYKGKSCGACHNGKKAFASTACDKCHKMKEMQKELSYDSGGISKAVFSHKLHTVLFKCDKCHTSIFKYKQGGSGMKMNLIYKGRFCGRCHDDKTAFGPMKCKKCHK